MTPERIAKLRRVLDTRQPDLTVLTDFVHKPRNLSAIIRNCDAVGIMALHAVLPREEFQAYRGTAMGSHRWVEVNPCENVEQAMATVQAAGMQVVAAHLSESSQDFRDIDYTRPTAVLLGAERRGVSDAAAERADALISVPMVGMVESLNVSVACGIILSEAQRQRQLAGLYDKRRIDDALYERLFFEWGHPQVRDYCEENGLAYPPLREDGEIDEPAAWYQAVREGRAPLAGEGR